MGAWCQIRVSPVWRRIPGGGISNSCSVLALGRHHRLRLPRAQTRPHTHMPIGGCGERVTICSRRTPVLGCHMVRRELGSDLIGSGRRGWGGGGGSLAGSEPRSRNSGGCFWRAFLFFFVAAAAAAAAAAAGGGVPAGGGRMRTSSCASSDSSAGSLSRFSASSFSRGGGISRAGGAAMAPGRSRQ